MATSAGLATAADPNLIVNGSFELPLVPAGFYSDFAAGSTEIQGWTVVGVDVALIHGSFTNSGVHFRAQEGVQLADLTGVTSNSQTSGVTQNVPTSIGQEYELSFYVGSASDGNLFSPSTIDVSIDNGPRVSFTNPATPNDALDWEQFSVSFSATGTTTNVTFFNGGALNNYSSALDNVTLIVGPPPIPALGAPGLVVLGGVMLLVAAARLHRARRRA
jgi:hypothetical protein